MTSRHTPRHAACHVITPHAMSSRRKSRHTTCCIGSLRPQAVLFLPPTNSQQNQPLDLPSVYVAVCLSVCLPICLPACLSIRFFFVLCACCCHLLWLPPTQQCTAKSTHHQASPACFRFRFVCRLPFAVRAPQCDMPCPALSCLPPLHDMTSFHYPLPTFPSRISESALD